MRVLHSSASFRLLLISLMFSGIGTRYLHAELTEQQKKDLIRKSHQAHSGSSPVKSSSSSSSKKKSPSKGSSSSGSSSSKKRSGTSGSRSGSSKKKSPASHSTTSTHSAGGSSSTAGSSRERAATHAAANQPSVAPPAASPATALPSSLPLPHGATPSAPITIEKSGVEADQGLEPVPVPQAPQAPGGFWSRIFGPRKSYAYLSSSTRAAIDRAPVRRGRWKYIVIHNSGTREGNARVFDIYHRRVRHMQNGLAYHFVIGDGHGSGDGQVEVGPRWTRQINGGHVASDYLNDIALGICLVGDFNRDSPTKAQIGALEELVSYLRNRVGRSQGRQAIVHAHKEINPRPTDCPGGRFPYGWLHAKFGNPR